MQRAFAVLVTIGAFTLLRPDGARAQTVEIVPISDNWTIEPFRAGYALLEPESHITYGLDESGAGLAHFPSLALTGSVVIPVFLVDWSDFNPVTDESNHDNPGSTFPGYVRKTPLELEAYLNATNGVAGYFNEISGGQLQLRFEVFPWIVSDQSIYLRDKEPTYYYFNPDNQAWATDTMRHAKDVLRSAVVDLGVDLSNYDADNNRVMDGFVIVYEGRAGKLAGTQLSWSNPTWYRGPPPTPALDNVAALVDTNDPNHALFVAQPVLFSRYCNLPEQEAPADPANPGEFCSIATWAHEIGHLLLGYRDYYEPPTSLGYYALSAKTGRAVSFHAAAMEKWLFGKWLRPVTVSAAGQVHLDDHHLKPGEIYSPDAQYLLKVLVGDDPDHFLTLENRHFVPRSEGGSYFNEDGSAVPTLESGIVIFEVNGHLAGSDQIRRLIPPRVAGASNEERLGAWRPGDVLQHEFNDSVIRIENFSSPSNRVFCNISFPVKTRIALASNAVVVSYPTRSNLNYHVEYCENLTSPEWQTLPGGPHNQGFVTDTNAVGAQSRFYRVITRNEE